MIARLLRSVAARERTKHADIQLGIMLAFIAGCINAGGFLAVGRYTSHMTGIVSSIGDALALHQTVAAWYSLSFLLAFISGAITSSMIIMIGRRRHYHSEFAAALMLEALLLLLFGISTTKMISSVVFSLPLTIALLCFIMGLQNALISKISHSVIRTTHVTGIATDIGIEIGRRLFRRLFHADIPVNAERLSIPVRLLLGFLIGSIVGAFSFAYLGFITIIPLALLLMLLAIPPIWKDLRHAQ